MDFTASFGAEKFDDANERKAGLLAKKRKELFQLRLVRMSSIFADFESLGVANGIGFVAAVKVGQLRAEMFRLILITAFKMAAHLAVPLLLLRRLARHQGSRTISAAFIELRFQGIERIQLLLNH